MTKSFVTFFIIITHFIPVLLAQAQTGELKGRVIHLGESVAGVNVGIKHIERGSSTDEQGYYHICRISAGEYILQALAVGYKTTVHKVTVKSGAILNLDIQLKKSLLELDQIVVTGTMRETYTKDSPVKVHVVSGELLRKNPASILMDSIGYINGLYEQVSCGVCGTNDIRVNGMDGQDRRQDASAGISGLLRHIRTIHRTKCKDFQAAGRKANIHLTSLLL